MAKVYESDVDPDDFIRSFREEPSGVSSLKKKPADNTEDKNPETAPAPESPPAVKPRQRSSASKEDEELFSQRFVRNMSHMRPQMKYLMVEVSPEFVRKIRRILSYENGPSCSVKAYVNNVLAEHFKEFEDIIKKDYEYRMSNDRIPTHKVTIAVTQDTTEIEVAPVDPARIAYIEKYLTRKDSASAKTYIYPEVLAVIKRMVQRCGVPQATIGGYLSEIILDHFEKNRDIMQSIFDDNKSNLFQ